MVTKEECLIRQQGEGMVRETFHVNVSAEL